MRKKLGGRKGAFFQPCIGPNGIVGGAFLDQKIVTVGFIVPGAAMMMVRTDEVEDAWSGCIERDIKMVGLLIQKMTRVSVAIAACSVVGAPHISANAQAVIR